MIIETVLWLERILQLAADRFTVELKLKTDESELLHGPQKVVLTESILQARRLGSSLELPVEFDQCGSPGWGEC